MRGLQDLNRINSEPPKYQSEKENEMKNTRKFRKALPLTLALLLLIAMVPVQTFAASKYCSFSSCTQTKQHTHSVCGKTSCKKTNKHSHNGKLYYGHSKNDGHAYHKCNKSGCTQKSKHTHTAAKHSNGHCH